MAPEGSRRSKVGVIIIGVIAILFLVLTVVSVRTASAFASGPDVLFGGCSYGLVIPIITSALVCASPALGLLVSVASCPTSSVLDVLRITFATRYAPVQIISLVATVFLYASGLSFYFTVTQAGIDRYQGPFLPQLHYEWSDLSAVTVDCLLRRGRPDFFTLSFKDGKTIGSMPGPEHRSELLANLPRLSSLVGTTLVFLAAGQWAGPPGSQLTGCPSKMVTFLMDHHFTQL